LELTIGTRARITHNLGVEIGLYNGRMCTIWGFAWSRQQIPGYESVMAGKKFWEMSEEEREMPIVLVKLDHDDRYKLSKDDIIPILAVDSECPITYLNVKNKYTRVMIPLVPAHGRTSHACQGITAVSDVIADTKNQFFAGLYVAMSRAKEFSQIWLTSSLNQRTSFSVKQNFRDIVTQFYELLRTKFTPPAAAAAAASTSSSSTTSGP
jgi:hypothetical protein